MFNQDNSSLLLLAPSCLIISRNAGPVSACYSYSFPVSRYLPETLRCSTLSRHRRMITHPGRFSSLKTHFFWVGLVEVWASSSEAGLQLQPGRSGHTRIKPDSNRILHVPLQQREDQLSAVKTVSYAFI